MTSVTIEAFDLTIDEAKRDPFTGYVNVVNKTIAYGARLTEMARNEVHAMLDDMQTDATRLEQLNGVSKWDFSDWGVSTPITNARRDELIARADLFLDLRQSSFPGVPVTDVAQSWGVFNIKDSTQAVLVPESNFIPASPDTPPYVPGYNPTGRANVVVHYSRSASSSDPAPLRVWYPNTGSTGAMIVTRNAPGTIMLPARPDVLDRLKNDAFSQAQQLAKLSQSKGAYLQDKMAFLDTCKSFTENTIERKERDLQEIASNIGR